MRMEKIKERKENHLFAPGVRSKMKMIAGRETARYKQAAEVFIYER